MPEHPLIELYVNHSDEQQNTLIEQKLAQLDLDGVIIQTLQKANVTQPVMLTLLITDDNGIRDMNKQYREQDKATDVLSFPLQEKPLVDAPADLLWPPQEEANDGQAAGTAENPEFVTPPGMVMNLGDIVISWPTIIRQAEQAEHTYQIELMYLLSHGVLHLIGYDDQTEAGYQAMVAIQQQVLQELGQKAYNNDPGNTTTHEHLA